MTRNRLLLGSGEGERPPSLATGSSAEVLRRLELTISRRLDGLLQGEYLGLVPGHGWEPGETRPYQEGDDVRRIDWNVTARTQQVHIRQTVADRELESWILADLSPSLAFGTADCEKRDLVIAAVAAVGFLTEKAGNRVGGLVLAGREMETIPARSGRRHLQAMLHRAVTAPTEDGSGATDLGAAVDRLGRVARRRGLAVVISDFLSGDDWERPLRTLGARHDVLAVEVVDPRELELPRVGMLELVDPETGQRVEIQSNSARLRRRYSEAALEQRLRVARSIRAARADHLLLRTDSDWLGDLVAFVALRRNRGERVARAGS